MATQADGYAERDAALLMLQAQWERAPGRRRMIGADKGYGPSERNEVIDAKDAAFGRLLFWRDVNHNGISEPEELQSVAEAGVVAFETDYKDKKRVDKHGNEFRQRATIVWQDGNDHMFDIWLRWQD
jgi:hypothetical protein